MKQNTLNRLIIVLLLLIIGVMAVWVLYMLFISPSANPVFRDRGETTTSSTVVPAPGQTPTPILGDPVRVLGLPDDQDNFDDDQNWTLFNNQCFQSEIRDGKYWMNAKGLQGVACWEVTWAELGDGYLETSLSMPQECSPDDQFGLFFRAPDNNTGYLFGLTCDGKYAFSSWDGSKTNLIIPPTENDFSQVEPGAINRIGVIATGSNFSFYINGNFVRQETDNSFLNPGRLGYFVRASTGSPFTVSFDDLRIWDLAE